MQKKAWLAHMSGPDLPRIKPDKGQTQEEFRACQEASKKRLLNFVDRMQVRVHCSHEMDVNTK